MHFDRLPAHVAIIMDGNGRWAAQRHLPRVEGHRAGIDAVRDTVETAARLGLQVLTLYAFSVENWKRPASEVSTLMLLLKRYLRSELNTLLRNDIRFRVIGRMEELVARRSGRAAHGDRRGPRRTAACCSTSRSTTAAAPRSSTPRAGRSKQACVPTTSTRNASPASSTPPVSPIPDLLIRTSGEMRVSNYLLWQIAYAEIYVTETLWPDFRRQHLLEAVLAYQKRERRYGGITPAPAVIGAQ